MTPLRPLRLRLRGILKRKWWLLDVAPLTFALASLVSFALYDRPVAPWVALLGGLFNGLVIGSALNHLAFNPFLRRANLRFWRTMRRSASNRRHADYWRARANQMLALNTKLIRQDAAREREALH